METGEPEKHAIHAAAREGRTSAVEALLNANPKLSQLRDADDRLPLHWALSYAQLPTITLLTSLPTFDPDAPDGSGWTPLMIAASLAEGEEIVALLLSKEADPNARNHAGQTALHFACSKAHLPIARALVAAGASARHRDRRGQLALHRAAAVGSVPMVRLCVEKRSPLNTGDVSGLTPLHHAVSEGHAEAAVELLRAGAEVDKRDGEGRLAIDCAPDMKVRRYIERAADMEGISLEPSPRKEGGGKAE